MTDQQQVEFFIRSAHQGEKRMRYVCPEKPEYKNLVNDCIQFFGHSGEFIFVLDNKSIYVNNEKAYKKYYSYLINNKELYYCHSDYIMRRP